jgi:hypothetical protein
MLAIELGRALGMGPLPSMVVDVAEPNRLAGLRVTVDGRLGMLNGLQAARRTKTVGFKKEQTYCSSSLARFEKIKARRSKREDQSEKIKARRSKRDDQSEKIKARG